MLFGVHILLAFFAIVEVRFHASMIPLTRYAPRGFRSMNLNGRRILDSNLRT
jgi:hypothetical protein